MLQKGGEFIRGVMAHEHPADPGITKKTKVKAKVREFSYKPKKQLKSSKMNIRFSGFGDM